MRWLYGHSMAAELREGTRYDQIAEALGCQAELVDHPDQLRGALDRAFSSNQPTLINALTDPDVIYPRKSVLA
jgi:acetolactate synthase-1/2/3 large subunit